MNDIKDQPVLVLGLGVSGLAMARWCVRLGAHVTVADTRQEPPQLQTLRDSCPDAAFAAGPFDDALLARAEWALVARSPGLAPDQLTAAKAWADAKQVRLQGELDLFALALKALSLREDWPYRPKVLAITGTNGKTTVTSLTTLLLQRCGWRVAMAGNIGPSLLDVLSESLDHEAIAQAEDDVARAADEAQQAAATELAGAGHVAETVSYEEDVVPSSQEQTQDISASELPGPSELDAQDSLELDAGDAEETTDEATAQTDASNDEEDEGPALIVPPPPEPPEPPHLPQVWVLELSSFQLDGVAGGAWDSIPTAATVLNVTEDHLDWHGSLQAYADAKRNVFGTDALMVLNREDDQVMAMTPGLVTVKVSGRNRQVPARPYQTFGLDLPVRAGDWGIESMGAIEWLARALAVDETRKRGRNEEAEELYYQRMMPVDALRIQGRHNAMNALAALALATSTGAPLAPMLHGLREYRGEPHRVESVGLIDGVEYFDDSKGTNVGATLAAIEGLGPSRKLVLILGGDGKGQNFEPLAPALARFAAGVVFIGRDGPVIRAQVGAALEEAGVPMSEAFNMIEAVAAAASYATPGSAVLLSPACASLDMYRNYAERAEAFIAAVQDRAADLGVVLEGGA